MFDYEWATVQHNVNCRLARAVVVPDAIPPERLERYGARGKVRAYEGLKEEYYLADFEPDAACSTSWGSIASRPIVVVRTPPEVSLYHRFENDLFARVLQRLREAAARARACSRWCCRACDSQRAELARGAGLHGARARDRRAVADRLRGSGDLRRRDDEPRGGGARHAGVHHVRGAPGRRRRAPDRRRPPAQAARTRSSWSCASATAIPLDAASRARRRVRRAAELWCTCCSSPLQRRDGPYNRANAPTDPRGGPVPSTGTRCPSWRWTGRWSRSPTTSRSSCASTAGQPARDCCYDSCCSNGRSGGCWPAACSCWCSRASTSAAGATRASATTRRWCARSWRSCC